MGCAASQSAGNSVPAAPDVTRAAPVVEAAAAAAPEFTAVQVGEWGAVVFRQFDTDKDGQLSKKELGRALKSLPRTKPKNVPPGAKFMSVDAMIDAMDADGDGGIDEQEWLVNLTKCAGLAAALAENVGADGSIPTFRSFEDQQAKRKREVAELEAMGELDEAQQAQLAEFKRQIDSLQKKIEEANANALKVKSWGESTFKQFDTNNTGKLTSKELMAALKSLPRTKPKYLPPGAKFMSVDAMIDAMDANGDGGVDLEEWLVNLTKCAGLAAALAENVGAGGTLANFQAPDPAAQEPAAAGQPAEAVVAAETVAEPEPEG